MQAHPLRRQSGVITLVHYDSRACTAQAVVAAALILTWGATAVRAQTVNGMLRSAVNDQLMPYGTISVGDDAREWFTDAAGRFVLARTNDETYRLRARQIGFAPLDTTVHVGGDSPQIVIRLRPLVIDLESRRNTTNERSCDAAGIRTSANPSALASALDLLRENGDRYEVLLARYPFQHRWQERRYVQVKRGTDLDDSALVADTVVYDSRARHGYRIGSTLYQVRSAGRETELTIFLPTPRDFTDSLFQREHCFTYRGTSHHEIRIDFRPAHRITVPDVAGSIYLDQARYVVRRAVFELTHPEAMDPPIERFTVQATFDEIVPLVPVLTSLHGEQRLATAWRFEGAAGGEGVERTAIDDKRMIGRVFLGAIGGQSAPITSWSLPLALLPATVACGLPSSNVMTDVLIYGTLDGPGAADDAVYQVIDSIQARFRLPETLTLPVYGYRTGTLVAPTLGGQVTFTMDPSGHATRIAVSATLLSPTVDSSLAAAVLTSGSARVLRPLRAGRYTLSLSALPPASGAASIGFVRLKAEAFHLDHGAALEPDSTQPPFPTDRPFDFVVDEYGRAILATAHMAKPSPETVSEAVAHALPRLRFRPAVIGGCRVKQQVVLPSGH